MRKIIAILPLIILTLIVVSSCKKRVNCSGVPSIAFEDMSPDSVISSPGSKDTVNIFFRLNDCDGDIGLSAASQIILIESRGVNSEFSFYFPDVPNEVSDADRGIKATCTLKVEATNYLVARPDPAHINGDTLTFDMYIIDEAGNKSNTITTPNIYMFP